MNNTDFRKNDDGEIFINGVKIVDNKFSARSSFFFWIGFGSGIVFSFLIMM